MKKTPDPTKTKEHYNQFSKKGKQIQKIPNNSNIKSVAVKHSKTASIEKSSIIT